MHPAYTPRSREPITPDTTISPMSARPTLLRAALLLFWLAGIGVGWSALARHSAMPGPSADAPAEVSATGGARLLVFAHPRCPCTPATLRTLARLLRATPDHDVAVEIHVMVPTDAEAAWTETQVWALARELPGAAVHPDPGGAAARQYGAAASGQVLFYDAAGALRFAGGLTAGRGHEGQTAGQDALLAAIRSGSSPPAQAPVYGCDLHDADAG